MVLTKDLPNSQDPSSKDASPPPYTAVPAPGQPSATGSGSLQTQGGAYQTSQFPAGPPAGGAGGAVVARGGEGLPAPASAGRDWTSADKRARRRFLVAFLWAIAIWLFVGIVLGGFGAMDYGRHPHNRPNRPDRPNRPERPEIRY